MIEQPARVVAARPHTLWVRSCAASECGACAAGRGCGAGWLLRWFGSRVAGPFALAHTGGHEVGDRVVLSISERWLLRAAGAVYGLPLLGLLVGAALGDRLGQDLGAIVVGITGFTLAAWFGRSLNVRLAKQDPLAVRAAEHTSGRSG